MRNCGSARRGTGISINPDLANLAIRRERRALAFGANSRSHDLIDQLTDLRTQPPARQLHQIQARFARGLSQVSRCVTAELHYLEPVVHDHRRRRVTRQKKTVHPGLALRFRNPGGGFRRRLASWFLMPAEIVDHARRVGPPPVNAVALVYHLKIFFTLFADILGSSQNKIPVRLQRVVEKSHDPALQHRAEIYQKIATGNQVQPRERADLW